MAFLYFWVSPTVKDPCKEGWAYSTMNKYFFGMAQNPLP